MSLINKKVSDFKAQAYQNGEFKEVTLDSIKGNGQYSSSIQQTLHLFAQLN